MRNEWCKTKEKIEGHTCIRRILPMEKKPVAYEYGFSGRYGDIWPKGPGTYSAIIKPGLTQNNVFQALLLRDKRASLDDEALVHFTSAELPAMLTLLGVSKSAAVQIRWANRF